MRRWVVCLVILIAFPLRGGITSAVQEAGVAGCSAFAETTWDNLTGWTQVSYDDFSADSTNDELDLAGLPSDATWIRNDTDTTSANHCVMWEYKSISGDMDRLGNALRMSSSLSQDAYVVGYEDGVAWFWKVYEIQSDNAVLQETVQTSTAISGPSNGDYVSACVTGTGNDTIVTLWDHGGSDPGDCRSDWGTADITFTNDPTNAVNSNTRVGLVMATDGASSSGSFDEFVGSDY